MPVRYIKLGEKGCYAESCILGERTNPDGDCIRLGYETPNQPEIHQACLDGRWDEVRNYWRGQRNTEQAAANDVRQIRDFYTLDGETIWCTFFRGLLWWCQAEPNVQVLPDHTRIRRAIDGWRCENPDGVRLTIDSLDGRLTQKASYQGTICEVRDSVAEYLIRKINGEEEPEVVKTRQVITALNGHVEHLIRGLWWHDFEVFVDLIFARTGWQRTSILGKTQEGFDMIYASPINDRRVMVQVKSRAELADVEEFAEFAGNNFDEIYFVVHTPHWQGPIGVDQVQILGPEKLAELCINCGLIQWLIDKRA